jgi:hypothetical protein
MAKAKSPNILALARRDEIMSYLKPDPGYVLVSSDGCSCEPTVTAALSGDSLYTYAALTGIGQPLKYSGDILMIPDIYTMTMSVSPAGKDFLRNHIDSVGGIEKFSQMYLTDQEAAMKPLKKMRTLFKVVVLASTYGAQPKRIYKILTEAGEDVTQDQCQAIWEAFWGLFAGVAALKKRCERLVKRQGYLVNPFGYRQTPNPRDAFNALIQSSVNPIITLYENYLMEQNPDYIYVVRVHDEAIFQVPIDKVDGIKQAIFDAEERVNQDIQWPVRLRFGMAIGNNFLEAK